MQLVNFTTVQSGYRQSLTSCFIPFAFKKGLVLAVLDEDERPSEDISTSCFNGYDSVEIIIKVDGRVILNTDTQDNVVICVDYEKSYNNLQVEDIYMDEDNREFYGSELLSAIEVSELYEKYLLSKNVVEDTDKISILEEKLGKTEQELVETNLYMTDLELKMIELEHKLPQ